MLVKDQTPSVPSLKKILSNEIDFLKRGSVLQPQLEKRATMKEHRTNNKNSAKILIKKFL